jgi:outer membrane protein OmpA-like peptidoglycan-associated protein
MPELPEEPLSSSRFLLVLLTSAFVSCAASLVSAQQPWSAHSDEPIVEVFGGYTNYHVGDVNGAKEPGLTTGWAGQFILNTSRWTGLVVDASGQNGDSSSAREVAVGMRFQKPTGRFIPFGEALAGIQDFTPRGLASQLKPALAIGAGVDVKVTSRISIRPVQLSYVFSSYNTEKTASSPVQKNALNGVRVQSGLVFNFGVAHAEEAVVSARCSAEPSAVDAGDQVKINVVSTGFPAKRTVGYSYTSTGGVIVGSVATASVDTTSVEPGTYAVTTTVVDNGRRKHRRTASCQTAFSVKAKLPPTLSISADPASVRAGDASTVAAIGRSPDGRPLSYICSSDGGRLTGSGSTFTLDTAGTPEGTLTVNCTVSDDRSLSASASTSIVVTIPKKETPQPSKFGSIEFAHDAKRPTRVDNEAKAELDRFADALAAAPDTKGAVIGFASAAESTDNKAPSLADERAVNTKDYLQKEKGVDPARIELRSGSGDEQKAELWIVPPGATIATEGNTVVDENKVKAVPRVPLKPKPHKKAQQAHHKHR